MISANFAILPIGRGIARTLLLMLLLALGLSALPAFAETAHVSEANLVLPNLNDVSLAQFPRRHIGFDSAFLRADHLYRWPGLRCSHLRPNSPIAGASFDG
jgi:hypothetical protein